jgi:Arc/MetJ-type ribon-helix-helix transcriptional regulator
VVPPSPDSASNGPKTMPDQIVTLKLNQQQIELIDRTVERGEVVDRASLVRRALREFAARHGVQNAAQKREER